MDYVLFVIGLISVWIIMSVATNLVVGYAGLLSIAHAAYMGIGAYIILILNIFLGMDYFLAIGVGVVATAIVAVLTVLPLLRLGSLYFGVATMGLNFVVVDFLHNVAPRTPGSEGLIGVRTPELIASPLGRTVFAVALMLVVLFIGWRLARSPVGRVLQSIRDDESAAQSLGKNTFFYKVWVWGLSGALSALAGGALGVTLFYIDPYVFSFVYSIYALIYIGVGGLASIMGSILGPTLLIAFSEGTRFLGLPSQFAGAFNQALYSLLLVFIMIFRRQGIIGKYDFRE